jgi:CPA1 family monovalent cation:H+ antiporter
VLRWWIRRRGSTNPRLGSPTVATAIVGSWCGMRGIVTLAAALALPADFSYRDLIVFCAFIVVLATLVLQGMTLGPLMRRLGLQNDDTVAREVEVARAEVARAAIRMLERERQPEMTRILINEYRARLRAAESSEPSRPAVDGDGSLASLQRRTVEAQREALTALRTHRVIGDDAFHVIEEEIDLVELTADVRVRPAVP